MPISYALSVTQRHIYTLTLWNFEDLLELPCMSNKPRNLWPKIVSCGHYVHVSVLNLLNAIACRTHAYGKKSTVI
jgi:hypothetical protein